MLFQFQTGDVTFFSEDRAYFEKRFIKLEKILGIDPQNADSIEARVVLAKSKHQSGNRRFEATATITFPGGQFRAETTSKNIKQCADELKAKLRAQAEAFRGKRVKK